MHEKLIFLSYRYSQRGFLRTVAAHDHEVVRRGVGGKSLFQSDICCRDKGIPQKAHDLWGGSCRDSPQNCRFVGEEVAVRPLNRFARVSPYSAAFQKLAYIGTTIVPTSKTIKCGPIQIIH